MKKEQKPMDYTTTIRHLKARRDYYTQAVIAMEAIHADEHRAQPKKTPRRKAKRQTPRRKAKRQRTTITAAQIQQTMGMSTKDAADAIGCSYGAVSGWRRKLAATNGRGELAAG